MTITVSLESDPIAKRGIQQSLTVRLPGWFRQGEPSLSYAEQAEVLPGYVARLDDKPEGLLIYKKQSALAAEIFWLGVDPARHRSGIGRALITAACDAALADRLRFLLVWTHHVRSKVKPYEGTRRFYEAMGFQYLTDEHFPGNTHPLALYMKSLA
ncbi:GNAT family N-acetyltransferase [Bradyrhizobium sp. USDA 336]|uniref:GNAT family N-acetyltransferase n=1 Tax=Bradyrhizobium sp. USDA 336 TaxID=3156311 RepID=UPI0038393916